MSFNRKRRFGNDDYQQPYQKRFRLPPIVELSKTLCGDINTLGESSKKYVEDVEFMTAPIINNFDSEKTLREAVLNTLFGVITEQPQKVLHISGLIQVVNSKNPSIGKTVAEFFHQKVQELIEHSLNKEVIPESFETGPWNKVKLILRFLSTLSSIIKDTSLVSIYQQFLNLAISLQNLTPKKRSPLAEAIYYNTLINVPYLVSYGVPSEDLKKGVEEIIELAENFKITQQDITITKPFVGDSQTPYEPKNIVSLILPALKQFISNGFQQVYKLFPELGASLQHLIDETEKYNLPQFSIPQPENLKEISGLDNGLGSIDGMWRTPRLTFEVYLPLFGFDTVPKSTDYTGLLFDDIVVDIVEALEFNRKEVARQIITLDLFFAEGIFSPPASNIDQLKDIHQRNQESEIKASTWKTEDVAIKNILSLIFKLPTVSQPFAYFYTTLVEACTNAAQAIAPVLGRAIRFFYSNIHIADFELRFRYLDWLAVQLSNFNFTWKWREWEGDSIRNSKSKYHPRMAFVRNLIAKELRLATSEKIEQTLTEEFHKYLDIRLFSSSEIKDYYTSLFGEDNLTNVNLSFEEEQSEVFFLRENVSLKEDAEKLIDLFHRGASVEEYKTIIDAIKEKVKGYESPDKLLVTFVFQLAAFVGNRSLSHAGNYAGKTYKFLRSLLGKEIEHKSFEATKTDTENGDVEVENVENQEASAPISEEEILKRESWAVDAVIKYWNWSPENGFLVLDVLESYDVLSSKSLIKYCLDDAHTSNFGLVNVSAYESIFRLLTTATLSGNSSDLLNIVYKDVLSILSSTLEKISTKEIIQIPDVNGEFSEDNEVVWKYHTALGFLRAVLRKFSDEYVVIVPELEESLNSKIQHESTKEIVKQWFTELELL